MRDEGKQNQSNALMQRLGATRNRLDYVAAWFLKAGEYVQTGSARIGFVATNSIAQGEQVSLLWPALFRRYKLEIAFAHRTFEWGSDARGKAHVHVVIIGLAKHNGDPSEKRLFSYQSVGAEPTESRHLWLSPYLIDAGSLQDRHLVVERAGKSLCERPVMCVGSKPVDGGHYIFDEDERHEFLKAEPGAAAFMHPFIGGYEYLNG